MKIMELSDLKSDWHNAGVTMKSEGDLLKMTRINNHPTLKKIRSKLIIETFCFILFLSIYYDWFDGDKKPMYANALLVSSLLLFIANDMIGYFSIVKKFSGRDIKNSLEIYLARIKRLSIYSMICIVLYSFSILLFFTSVIHFTKEKSFILLSFVILLFQMLFWSQRIWNKWIKSLQQQLKNFEIEEVSKA